MRKLGWIVAAMLVMAACGAEDGNAAGGAGGVGQGGTGGTSHGGTGGAGEAGSGGTGNGGTGGSASGGTGGGEAGSGGSGGEGEGGSGEAGSGGQGGTGGSIEVPQELDCAWFTGDNCWKQALASLRTCVPPSGDVGAFDDDRTDCHYANAEGDSVHFARVPTDPLPNDWLWNFTLSNEAGGTCARFLEAIGTGGNFVTRLESPIGTVILDAQGDYFEVTCPDDTAYATDDIWTVLSCSGGINNQPGTSYSQNDGILWFALNGSGDEAVSLFRCE